MKKRLFAAILVVAMTVALFNAGVITSNGANQPVITQQPQNPTYNAGAVAVYTVTVSGEGLSCYWYMNYQGKEYCISDCTGGQPWENYAGSSYGQNKSVNGKYTTFTYYFNGIGAELNGAHIYAVVEDGHYDVKSDKAYITVVEGAKTPPTTRVPAYMEIYEGEVMDLYCEATSYDGSALSYIWYETGTGKLENITALNRGGETADTLRVDTSKAGKRYYVCGVTTASGGSAYTSVIPVTVIEKPIEAKPPVITTKVLPEATEGKAYNVKLACSDSDAAFTVYTSPDKANDFSKTGLNLTQHGELEGVPAKAGAYTFTVSAKGEGGVSYMTYTLNVKRGEAETTAPEETTVPVEDTTAPEKTSPEETTDGAVETKKPVADKNDKNDKADKTPKNDKDSNTEKGEKADNGGLPWWGTLLISVGACGLGAGGVIVFVFIKKARIKR